MSRLSRFLTLSGTVVLLLFGLLGLTKPSAPSGRYVGSPGTAIAGADSLKGESEPISDLQSY